VKFSFLDFSTISRRKAALQRELFLNSRLAADLYIDVFPVVEKQGEFEIGQKKQEEALDYCLKMNRINPEHQMDHLIRSGKVEKADINAVASQMAAFHRTADIVAPPFDLYDQAEKFMDLGRLDVEPLSSKIEHLMSLGSQFHSQFKGLFMERGESGFIRDVHGDLTSKNIFLNPEPVIFDCIEFDDRLRQIDILSDIGFFIMDMKHLGKLDFARYFIKQYEKDTDHVISGDEKNLLHYYIAYRANVRAKINCLSLQNENANTLSLIESAGRYLDLAIRELEQV
jgi:aminoglycoside phosphotransferase family enzyme